MELILGLRIFNSAPLLRQRLCMADWSHAPLHTYMQAAKMGELPVEVPFMTQLCGHTLLISPRAQQQCTELLSKSSVILHSPT
ncbi:hypothetical protein HK14_11210 [Acetobacter cibinongensis]|uniref:Uncharacterized protein n=1 Tax=Acetobacter cibinongensis TaxID=146475 RepID=A0A1Z5YS70_9PROT|nr:hypothetical protein HK14_11210 [Acetobacter cibinongensis]